jgi:hypothetical protein
VREKVCSLYFLAFGALGCHPDFLILPLLYSLHRSSIGDEGAAAIAEGLTHNRGLQRLK